MNILIIDNSPGFTGAFKCALNEALLLSDVHQVSFLIPSHSTNKGLLEEKGFKVYVLPLKELSKSFSSVAKYPFYLLANISRLKQIVRKEKITLVQVNDFYNLLGAGLKMIGSKVKLITYVRFLPSSLPSPLRNIWTKTAQKYSDAVVTVSDAVLKELPANDNTIRIYDSVKLEEKLPYHEYADEVKTFLYLANFTRGKGQEHALQAFEKAYQKNKNLRLKFVGGYLGLEKNKMFRDELEAIAHQSRLNEVVHFHDFEKDTERLIKSSFALLNFSEAESFSMTCLEASYYGTPVIATRCGGPEEIIAEAETGLLVAKKNIDEMTKAMLSLAEDNHLRNRYSSAGREYVRGKFSQKQFLEQFQKMLARFS